MPKKKDIFGIAKGSPAVGIPLAVAKVGRKAQDIHSKFAAKHPRVHAAHKTATRKVSKAVKKVVRKVRGR